ncbi:MAG TPA: phosphate/phosphite/phosphonate ABC transporter substrate-binding protein [Nitrososphaera sp.]|nr:phosphate/phosphite/phosphonate ABC transporter substrate-binding protein [Nitrososphaera sp.]
MNKYVLIIPAILAAGIAIGYAATFATASPNTARETTPTVTVAIQPTANAADIQSQATELETFLEKETGYEVDIYVPTSYAGVVEALRFGQADMALMSAWPSYLAVQKAGATLELAEVREVVIGQDLVEETYYYSYWVTKPDAPYTSLEDLRGARAAFPSPLSTSGYVIPMKTLVDEGLVTVPQGGTVDPKTFFSEVRFAGGYAQGWEALKNGQVDVTVIAGDVSESLYRDVIANTKIIAEQGPIPSHGVVFSKDIDPEVKQKLKEAMLKLGQDDASRQITKKLVSAIFVGFRETTAEEHLSELTPALQATGLSFTESLK